MSAPRTPQRMPAPDGRPARARIAAEVAWDGCVDTTADLARYLVGAGWSWTDARVAIGDCLIYGLLSCDRRGRIHRATTTDGEVAR
jgi:hypothetical protein